MKLLPILLLALCSCTGPGWGKKQQPAYLKNGTTHLPAVGRYEDVDSWYAHMKMNDAKLGQRKGRAKRRVLELRRERELREQAESQIAQLEND